MKELVIYIHTVNQINENNSKKWLQQFTQSLQSSLNGFDISINAITNQKEAFFNALKGNIVGCYLPILDKAFIESETEIYNYRNIVGNIENGTSNQAFHLCLIEEVVPINHAHYQPFYKFFNHGNSEQEFVGSIQEQNLPGKNNFISFRNHIQNIAKEISYLLLKLSSSRNNKARVFIGSTTSDLLIPVNSLYNFLLGKGIEVITPITTIGLSHKYVEKRLNKLIQKCWLAIHPLGDGTLSNDLFLKDRANLIEIENTVSSAHFKENKANSLSEIDFKRILWIPKATSGSNFEGHLINRLKAQSISQTDAEIMSCSLDELKGIILSYYKDSLRDGFSKEAFSTEQTKEVSTDSLVSRCMGKVFVLFENKYGSKINNLSKNLKSKGFQSITLKDIETENDFTKAKNMILQHCEGVIFLTSNWNSLWFKSNLNEVVKAKSIRTFPFGFLCIMSNEIKQLPYDLDRDLQLIKLSGDINQEAMNALLLKKKNSVQ